MTNIFDITNEDFITLVTILDQMQQKYNLEDDIHNHSRFLGEQSKTFLALDDKYQISNISQSFVEVYNQINQYANDVQVLEVLNTIKNSAEIEPETQLNVKNLLVRTWSLATHMFSPNNMKDLIIYNLKHNKLAKGGCLAGISTRLTQPYCVVVRSILERAKAHKASSSNMPLFSDDNYSNHNSSSLQQINNNRSREIKDDDFVKACELSRINYLEQQPQIREEDELQLALALSLSLGKQEEDAHREAERARTEARARVLKQQQQIREEDELQLALALSLSLAATQPRGTRPY
ncbi:MAG: hypothetical protein ACR2HS_01565 [Gammaproteobacteria bacterium]